MLLYVNIPFCRYKCQFCFKTHAVPPALLLNGGMHEAYVAALEKNIMFYLPTWKKHAPIKGINWGGGTPTALSVGHIERIASCLGVHIPLSRIPFSVEGTPDTLTKTMLKRLKRIGVNRLSIGIQSFNDRSLRALGRGHNAAAAARCVGRARDAGFDNINMDLIIALPGESQAEILFSVRRAIRLGAPHITTYFYTPCKGSVLTAKLARSGWTPEGGESNRAIHSAMRAELEGAGYANYEFFHWSRDHTRWRYFSLDHYFGHVGDVVGFGAGAQSFIRGFGNLEYPGLERYLADPLTMRRGSYGLEYVIERALGSRAGVHFPSIAGLFGIKERDVRIHPLSRAFRDLPGVTVAKRGVRMKPEEYQRQYINGLTQRLRSIRLNPGAWL